MALLGFDQPTAEVFVNLATGATLPDAGEVSIFGRPPRAIDDSADWLATVDRFGIVSERAVLLDALTVIQNLAMPFTLEIEPPPDEVRLRAEALAREVGLPDDVLDAAGRRARCRRAGCGCALGRAIALDPAIVLLEHASARAARGTRWPPWATADPRRGREARDRDRGAVRRRDVCQRGRGTGPDAGAGDRPSQATAPRLVRLARVPRDRVPRDVGRPSGLPTAV